MDKKDEVRQRDRNGEKTHLKIRKNIPDRHESSILGGRSMFV